MRDFAALLAPVSARVFFAEHFAKSHVHIGVRGSRFRLRADEGSGAEVSPERLLKLAEMSGVWTSRTFHVVMDREVLGPELYCCSGVDRAGVAAMIPDPALVNDWLSRGASLVLDDMDGMIPAVSEVAATLEEAFDARVQGNAYISQRGVQAFASHFDTHDVFALHISGRKTWNLYQAPISLPINHARFSSYTDAQHRENRGALRASVTLEPGDLLYIPRGLYHDALTDTDIAVHIAFGVNPVLGVDVLDALRDTLIDDAYIRAAVPHSGEGDEVTARYMRGLAQRVEALARDSRVVAQLRARQRRNRFARGAIRVPGLTDSGSIDSGSIDSGSIDSYGAHASAADSGPLFRVVAGFALKRRGARMILVHSRTRKAVEVPEHRQAILRWILAQEVVFSQAQVQAQVLGSGAPSAATPEAGTVLAELVAMGVVESLGADSRGSASKTLRDKGW